MRQQLLLQPALVLAISFGIAHGVFAGPPFLTDDPVPVDCGHYELILFSTGQIAKEFTNLESPAAEFNFGAAPNLQLHLGVPFVFDEEEGGPRAFGLGDIELGAKYRFIQEAEWRPQVSLYPNLELPTGDSGRGLGNGRLWGKLPLWAQKSWDPWTTYAGGGYVAGANSAVSNRDYFFGGWLLQRDLSEKLTLGGEFFAEGPTMQGEHRMLFLNFGGAYNFSKNFSLLLSAGHTILGDPQTVFYIGLYWTWGGAAQEHAAKYARWSLAQQ